MYFGIGVEGNSLTITNYIKQTHTPLNRFILAFAFTDQCVSAANFAGIVELVMNIKMYSRFGCKTVYVLYYRFVGMSAALVSINAIDRYRRMCTPKTTQVNVFLAKKIISETTVLILLVALRAYLTVDVIQITFDSDQTYAKSATNTSHVKEQSDVSNITEFRVLSLDLSMKNETSNDSFFIQI